MHWQQWSTGGCTAAVPVTWSAGNTQSAVCDVTLPPPQYRCHWSLAVSGWSTNGGYYCESTKMIYLWRGKADMLITDLGQSTDTINIWKLSNENVLFLFENTFNYSHEYKVVIIVIQLFTIKFHNPWKICIADIWITVYILVIICFITLILW